MLKVSGLSKNFTEDEFLNGWMTIVFVLASGPSDQYQSTQADVCSSPSWWPGPPPLVVGFQAQASRKPLRPLVKDLGAQVCEGKDLRERSPAAFIVVTQLTVHPLPPSMVKLLKWDHSVHLVTTIKLWLLLLWNTKFFTNIVLDYISFTMYY